MLASLLGLATLLPLTRSVGDGASCAAQDAASFLAQIQSAPGRGDAEQQQQLAEWLASVTRGQNYTADVDAVVRADRRIREPPVTGCRCDASTGSGCRGALRIPGGVSETVRPGLPSGFGALFFLHTLNGLMFAERRCLAPVVDFAAKNSRAYHDPERGNNSWAYFYEPIGATGTAAAPTESEIVMDWEILLAEYREPWSIHVPWPGYWPPTAPAAIAHAERLVAQLYKLKPAVQARVEEEWVELHRQMLYDPRLPRAQDDAAQDAVIAAGSRLPVLGLHIRGTDAPLLDGRTSDTAAMYARALPPSRSRQHRSITSLATDSVRYAV
jgi:hypothetical protein